MIGAPPGDETPKRILAIADTDSYLKWSAATLAALPPGWQASQVVIENPVTPSPEQMRAASALPVDVLDRAGIVLRLRAEKPDVVLLACTGPVVATLAASRELRGRDRPVLLTGLPGISVPATPRVVALRRSCDLFVLPFFAVPNQLLEQTLVTRGADFRSPLLELDPVATGFGRLINQGDGVGMSTMRQIRHAVEVLGSDNVLLCHATSTYPAQNHELNLRMIHTLWPRRSGRSDTP